MELNYISSTGEVLSLTNGLNYKLINFDSQTAVSANISSVVISGSDGDSVNNVQAQPRTIVFDLRICSEVEETKRSILSVIKLKQQGTIQWEQNNRWLEIKGIVEAIEMPRWTNQVVMQITMHCEQPYWENIDYVVSQLSEAKDLHYFTDIIGDMLYFPASGIPLGEYDTSRTKELYNASDVSVGLEIEIQAFSTVTNPIIYNQNGDFFGCGYGTDNKKVVMTEGDIILINTRKNEKEVTLNGVSILDKIKPQSTWLQLGTGNNTFTINSDDTDLENMTYSLMYKQRYI